LAIPPEGNGKVSSPSRAQDPKSLLAALGLTIPESFLLRADEVIE